MREGSPECGMETGRRKENCIAAEHAPETQNLRGLLF